MVEVDGGFEGLVGAVLRPGQSDGLELDVGGSSTQLFEVLLDGSHLDIVQCEPVFAREGSQPGTPKEADLDSFALFS